MWSGSIGQWPSKKIAKIQQALRITCKGVWLANDLSQIIPKLPKDLKQNVNLNQTLLNEVDLKSWVSFLSIKFEHVDCHSSACLSQNKRSKNLQNWKENVTFNTYSNSIYVLHFMDSNSIYVLCFTYSNSIYVLCLMYLKYVYQIQVRYKK